MSTSHRLAARGIFLLAGLLSVVFGASTAFIGDGSDEALLAATFGPGMGLLTVASGWVVTSARPSRLLWAALCYLPVFFALHLAAFGTWLPDLPLLLATALALALTARGTAAPSAPGGATSGDRERALPVNP